MNKVEQMIKELSEKWKHKIQEQNVDEFTDKNKVGIWLLVMDDEIMSLVPMYKCSICGNSFSGYYPTDVCECCGAKMK